MNDEVRQKCRRAFASARSGGRGCRRCRSHCGARLAGDDRGDDRRNERPGGDRPDPVDGRARGSVARLRLLFDADGPREGRLRGAGVLHPRRRDQVQHDEPQRCELDRRDAVRDAHRGAAADEPAALRRCRRGGLAERHRRTRHRHRVGRSRRLLRSSRLGLGRGVRPACRRQRRHGRCDREPRTEAVEPDPVRVARPHERRHRARRFAVVRRLHADRSAREARPVVGPEPVCRASRPGRLRRRRVPVGDVPDPLLQRDPGRGASLRRLRRRPGRRRSAGRRRHEADEGVHRDRRVGFASGASRSGLGDDPDVGGRRRLARACSGGLARRDGLPRDARRHPGARVWAVASGRLPQPGAERRRGVGGLRRRVRSARSLGGRGGAAGERGSDRGVEPGAAGDARPRRERDRARRNPPAEGSGARRAQQRRQWSREPDEPAQRVLRPLRHARAVR